MSKRGWVATLDRLATEWRSKLCSQPFEVMEIALLDAKGQALEGGVHRLGVGSIDRVAIYPRQVMRAAVKADAAAVVICHNHPSGCSEPTRFDLDATRSVYLAGVSLDVKLLDHLIVSDGGVFSFRSEGLL